MKRALTVEAINEGLKLDRIPVSILLRGDSLYLQATLPPKPGEAKGEKRQRQIALGLKANQIGLEDARFKARQLGRELALGQFDWGTWNQKYKRPENISEWIERFRDDYLAQHKCSQATWDSYWMCVLKRLPQSAAPSDALFLAVVTSISADEHPTMRRRACSYLQRFADFIGLDVDLRPYAGSKRKDRAMQIPSDAEILEYRDQIRMDSWKWVYGMLAAFGLRGHEVFFCCFDEGDRYLLKVSTGKTGSRTIRALYPEWVDLWNLTDTNLPIVHTDLSLGYRELGARIYKSFKRCDIPFTPYALRHAYGIRGTVTLGIPTPTMAAWMGHSPTVHLNIYNRWASQQHHDKVFNEKVRNREGSSQSQI